MIPTIQTKYGTAKNYEGYFIITSWKEGNNCKKLHRLIYEDYHKVTLLDGTDVHHIDGDKTNNAISNLELIPHTEHGRLHALEQIKSDETKLKIAKTVSKNNNTTGYFRVSKQKDNTLQGFSWRYIYPDGDKRKILSSVDINKLKEKVLAKGLEWFAL